MENIIDEVIRRLQSELEGTAIGRQETLKNNGQKRIGICIHHGDGCAAPVVYIDHLVKKGWTEADIAAYVVDTYYKSHWYSTDLADKVLKDYGSNKDFLNLRLVNYQKNKTMLDETPHRLFLDLAVIVVFDIPEMSGVRGVVNVHDSLLKAWKQSFGTVYRQALQNFHKEKSIILNMREVLHQCGNFPGTQGSLPMYILSNPGFTFGSVRMLDGEAIRKFASQLDADLVVLPSSVHETILLPMTERVDIKEFSRMVEEVNATEVEPEEVLSDHAYIYRRDKGWSYA
ncbi:DUF5688 family protein [Lachnospiraceae bacterium 29-84]